MSLPTAEPSVVAIAALICCFSAYGLYGMAKTIAEAFFLRPKPEEAVAGDAQILPDPVIDDASVPGLPPKGVPLTATCHDTHPRAARRRR